MLVDWKAEQDEMKEILGDEYMDYNLVMASTFGHHPEYESTHP